MRTSLVAGGMAVVVASMAIGSAADALEGTVHYVSVDDLRLQQEGYIVSIHEYLEITADPAGTLRIEAGYQHMGTSALSMLQILASEVQLRPDVGPEDLGRLDIPRMRRVAMTGEVAIEPGTLTWTADSLTPTLIEPGIEARGEDPRPSPFQIGEPRVTLERQGGTATDLGDRFSVIVDGRAHEYRRMDARLLPLAGYLAWMTESSVVQSRSCFLPIADAYLQGEAHAFSEAALSELRETAADMPGLAILEERGFGVALTHSLDAALAASEALNDWLAVQVEAVGVEAAMSALNTDRAAVSDEMLDWARSLDERMILTERLHILPGDPEWPAEGEQTDMRALFELVTARYETDPWSQTAPMASALARHGWVSVLGLLLHMECG